MCSWELLFLLVYQVKEMEASQSSLESRLKDLQEGSKSPEPSEEKVAATGDVAAEAVTAAAETVSEASEEAAVEKPTEEKPTPEEGKNTFLTHSEKQFKLIVNINHLFSHPSSG